MAYIIQAGTVASVKVICSANNGTLKWANTHEYEATVDVSYGQQVDAANQIATAYAKLLLPPYRVERVVISSWVPDGQPYNPDTFNVFQFSLNGQRTRTGSEPVDLTVCMSYIRSPSGGRTGRMLLRGILTEEMLVWVAGRANFAPPSSLDGVDFQDGEQSLFDLKALLTGGMKMVMKSASSTREILTITRGGIVFKKLNNKFFNRTRPPSGGGQ